MYTNKQSYYNLPLWFVFKVFFDCHIGAHCLFMHWFLLCHQRKRDIAITIVLSLNVTLFCGLGTPCSYIFIYWCALVMKVTLFYGTKGQQMFRILSVLPTHLIKNNKLWWCLTQLGQESCCLKSLSSCTNALCVWELQSAKIVLQDPSLLTKHTKTCTTPHMPPNHRSRFCWHWQQILVITKLTDKDVTG